MSDDNDKPFPTPRSWTQFREAEAPEENVEDMKRAMQMVVLESSRNKAQAAEEIASLNRHLASALERNVGLREEISRLKSEVEAGDKDEKELFALRKAYENSQDDGERLRKNLADLSAENRRLRDNQQSWLDKNRDLTVKVQTLMEVIESLR